MIFTLFASAAAAGKGSRSARLGPARKVGGREFGSDIDPPRSRASSFLKR